MSEEKDLKELIKEEAREELEPDYQQWITICRRGRS